MAKRFKVLPEGIRFPQWEHEYKAALKEIDTRTLIGLIEAAEPAMLIRREALQLVADNGVEQQAIDEALLKL